MDNTGAFIPNVSIQASGRGSSVDIWITYQDGWKHNTKDFWKPSRLRFLHVEKHFSSHWCRSSTVRRRTSSKFETSPIF